MSWICLSSTLAARETNLIHNPDFEALDPATRLPEGYTFTGAVSYGLLGRQDEHTSRGMIFSGDAAGGSVSQTIKTIDQSKGRWFTFRFRGLAEDQFTVAGNALAMKIDFYSKNGTERLDGISRLIYREIETDRKDLSTNGLQRKKGGEVWRSYELEELLPFPEIDTIVVSVSFQNGTASSSQNASFFMDDFSLAQARKSHTGKTDPAETAAAKSPAGAVDESKLVSLGGRWYYEPFPGESVSATSLLTVTDENADRLFYKSDRFINPFAQNMTAWLRAGYKDQQGSVVAKDRFIPDNVTLIFKGDGYLTLKSKNIPNHPTAQFPDTFGTQNYSPSYIQEFDRSIRLPLVPVLDAAAKVVDPANANHALPMGPIGVAVNGVVFYNPFDANSQDASNLVDRCCGHPSPDNMYHYHKYPACVNTPFIDKGEAPSQVIGFAFDGLPLYGPYESAGVLARDLTVNPLNGFNAHHDEVRGWHYHVTPGKFPYLIGGFYAKADAANFGHGGMGPQGMRPPGQGPGPDREQGPPPGFGPGPGPRPDRPPDRPGPY